MKLLHLPERLSKVSEMDAPFVAFQNHIPAPYRAQIGGVHRYLRTLRIDLMDSVQNVLLARPRLVGQSDEIHLLQMPTDQIAFDSLIVLVVIRAKAAFDVDARARLHQRPLQFGGIVQRLRDSFVFVDASLQLLLAQFTLVILIGH